MTKIEYCKNAIFSEQNDYFASSNEVSIYIQNFRKTVRFFCKKNYLFFYRNFDILSQKYFRSEFCKIYNFYRTK